MRERERGNEERKGDDITQSISIHFIYYYIILFILHCIFPTFCSFISFFSDFFRATYSISALSSHYH